MGLNKVFLALLLACASLNLCAQTDSTDNGDDDYLDDPIPWVKASQEGKHKFGVKMGMQYCTLLGTYPLDNKLMIGVLGGGLYRYNFKRGLSLQQEALISFRGGKFKGSSPDIGTIKILYLDFPLMLMQKLGAKSPHKLGLGVQYSTAINQLFYQDKSTFPTGASPAIDKNDWAVVSAYQYQLEYIAFQLAAKYGLRDINLGEDWPGNDGVPIPNKSGSMHNFAVELNIIF
jgi:hypothetical protein